MLYECSNTPGGGGDCSGAATGQGGNAIISAGAAKATAALGFGSAPKYLGCVGRPLGQIRAMSTNDGGTAGGGSMTCCFSCSLM